MDSQNVANIIADFPNSFKRPGSIFRAIQIALALPLANYTTASDALANSLVITNASNRTLEWLGEAWGIQKLSTETYIQYRKRILAIYSGLYGAANGIETFLLSAFNLTAQVSIASIGDSGAGYNVVFQNSAIASPVNAQEIIDQLKWIRPAGVPFLAYYYASGLYLGTINYLRAASVTGAYLASSKKQLTSNNNPITNNSVNELPTDFFTDPALTGQLTV